ncbi:JmjC domain-containing protein [Colletotrichum orchidophilum]|uniref:JmjC domain-containing protein n=1 Tax=Colletotrichum orchidophilum TaxID=1209926 RepID=A0A1G4B0A6_9PEZI|nr:JmjC domain-containing protein [Colletotrichum orchidophilum]OHE94732.1 JmjC domain-containing protein [Colletotrichum orchidophilum]
MSVFDNPAFIEECVKTTASIHADAVHHTAGPASGSPQRRFGSDAERGLGPVGPEILRLLEELSSAVLGVHASGHDRDQHPSLLTDRLDGEIERTYRRFYDFVYADLPYHWRQLYTDLSLLKFSALVFLHETKRVWEGVKGGGKGNGGNRAAAAAEEEEERLLDELVAVLDKALILAGGAGLARGRRTTSRLLGYLDDAPSSSQNSSSSSSLRRSTRPPLPGTFPSSRPFTPAVCNPIRVVDSMSMSAFQSYLDRRHYPGRKADDGDADLDLGPEPLVLTSLMTRWPALSTRPWSSPGYLLSRTHGGRRLVPVEVGRSYVDEGWTQELIPFRELLARVVAPPGLSSASPATTTHNGPEAREQDGEGEEEDGQGSTTGTTYLAQHELFAQLPHLQNDILTPDHCFTTPPPHPLNRDADKPELDVPLVNAWFGPAGTITPLHTDGYHNLLCQVVGAKYVRLYAPRDSEAMCPRGVEYDDDDDDDDDVEGKHEGDGRVKKVDMSNTSAFDVGAVEGWDPDTEGRDAMELEEFRGLRYWDCVLEAGDVLYIPIGWWHYVRSLSVSFSVSFWWNGDHYVGPEDKADD